MSWIERMRQKPDDEKRRWAFIVAIVSTCIIAALWIIARIAMHNS